MLRQLVQHPKAGRSVALTGLMVFTLVMGLVAAPVSPTFAGVGVRGGNKAAESNLRNGLAAALTYYTDGDTFTGFDAAQAAAIEPSLTWADGDAVAQNVVNIAGVAASGERVMLETLSGSGTSFCIARANDLGYHHGTPEGKDTVGGTFKGFHGCKNAPSGPWY